MFAMRYCKSCLEKFRGKTNGLENGEYLMLNIPVEDDFGLIFNAFLAIMKGDFLNLLDSEADVVDLSQHGQLMRIESANLAASGMSLH